MAVYIDNANIRYGRMVMSHMIADSTIELLSMADLIGLKREWIQNAGTPKEHFDVSVSRRRFAIRMGAVPITQRRLAQMIAERRSAPVKSAD